MVQRKFQSIIWVKMMAANVWSLNELKENSFNKLIMGDLEINPMKNKFDFLEDVINRHLNIILLSETKLDDTFHSAQFIWKGYGVPYRFDRSSKGGGILFYTCKDIPLKFLKTRFDCNIDSINSRKRKWLLMIHIVPVKALSNHLEYLNRIIDDNYRQKLPKFLVSGRL